jgi:protein-tyrosine-phosphatase
MTAPDITPPPFLPLVAHPLRWRLLSELAASDRRVRELCAASGEPQSLVSYHLRRLREVGAVSTRRSTADGRDTYYVADLARCRELFTVAATSLHPGVSPSRSTERTERHLAPADVLFLCTGNSSRSQIAEGLAAHLSHGALRAVSAGSNPKPVHRNAVRVLRTRGLAIDGLRSKHLSEFADRRFDSVITLCDRVREVCPEFPGGPRAIHWSVPDPSREPGTDDETLAAFERVADELAVRIGFLLEELAAPSTPTQEEHHHVR